MRRLALTVLAALASIAAGAGQATAAPPSPTAFVLAGGGWGHGVGMSQWGAFGQARAGRDYRAILAHYYPGTTLGPSPVAVPAKLRVLVADGVGAITVTTQGAINVVDAAGAKARVGGQLRLGPKLVLPPAAGAATSSPTPLSDPVTLRAADGGTLVVDGKAYRGSLRVVRAAKKLQLVNVVPLESYLLGVVPGEMPKDWPLDALEAQAVAARTYAIANLVEGRSFDLYSDARSQLYYGANAESPGTTRAVIETRGQVLSYNGAPAETFYFSSSGGKTLSALDAFGQDLPYLVSVDDPWDETSPNHRWETRLLGGQQLARRLGLQGAITDVSYEPGTPGAPAALRLTTSQGSTSEQRLSDIRNRLGLKSLEFTLGVLRIDRPADVTPQAGNRPSHGPRPGRRRRRLAAPVRCGGLGPGRAHRADGRRHVCAAGARCDDDGVPSECGRGRRSGAHAPDRGMSPRARVGLLGAVAVLALPAPAVAGRVHVGISPGANPHAVAAAVEQVDRPSRGGDRRPPRAVRRRHAGTAARARWRRVGRASCRPSARVRADGPTRDPPVVHRSDACLRRLGPAAAARLGARRGDRLRDRPHASGPRAKDRGGQELRRRKRAGHPGARHDRRGDHRRGAGERHGDRRAGARCGAARSRRSSPTTGRSRWRRRRRPSTGPSIGAPG